jgi:prepilin peptidase CpaA
MVRADHLPILGALLAVACASDVASRRVPNVLVVTIALGGVAAQWASGGAAAALAGTLGGAALLAVLLAGWALGKLGGGDVKLAAATAVWLGPANLVWFALLTGVAGVPVALAAYARRHLDLLREARASAALGDGQVALQADARHTVPLSVAIALGAWAVLWGVP